MPVMTVPMIKGDRLDAEPDYRDALAVNAVSVMRPVFDAEGYQRSHPGLNAFATVPGRDRGAIYNERLKIQYRVSGDELIKVEFIGTPNPLIPANGEYTSLGAISGEGNKSWSEASMPYSFNTQAIITDLKIWLHDGVTLTQITDPDIGLPFDGIWLNGYYLLTDGDHLFHTNIDNEYEIDPDQFATSEYSPDPTVGLVKTQDNQAMVLNRYTTEYFQDVANPVGFAFQRIPGKAVMAGLVGTHLKCELGGNVFLLGSAKEESPTMLVISPGNVDNISTREIDKIIGEYTEQELADGGTMESRTEDRDQLVYVRLPRHTLCYNYTVGQKYGHGYAWSSMQTGVAADPWTAVNGVYDVAGGNWIYGDRNSGRLALLTRGNSGQYGDPSEIQMHTPFIKIESASIDELEVETVPGYTLDESVTVFVSATPDGHSWGKEYSVEYGGTFNYSQRFIVRRFGNVNDWVGIKFRAVTVLPLCFASLKINFS